MSKITLAQALSGPAWTCIRSGKLTIYIKPGALDPKDSLTHPPAGTMLSISTGLDHRITSTKKANFRFEGSNVITEIDRDPAKEYHLDAGLIMNGSNLYLSKNITMLPMDIELENSQLQLPGFCDSKISLVAQNSRAFFDVKFSQIRRRESLNQGYLQLLIKNYQREDEILGFTFMMKDYDEVIEH